MAIELSKTQTEALQSGAAHDAGHITLPATLRGGARQKVLASLIVAKLAAYRSGTLVITATGMAALGNTDAPSDRVAGYVLPEDEVIEQPNNFDSALGAVADREVAMTDSAVLTVGTMQAGRSENVIPDEALLRLNIRTFNDEVRKRVLSAARRIIKAEASASGSPKSPSFSVLSEYPLTRNDEAATLKVVEAFKARFGEGHVMEVAPATASEDFGLFGAAWNVPMVFWIIGGIDKATFQKAAKAGTLDQLPANHSPEFAPAIHPTLETGINAMVTAAAAWLIE